MKIFSRPNMSDFVCPICSMSEDKAVVLIPVCGTEEGNKVKAIQIHLECIDLSLIQGNNNSVWLTQFINNDWNNLFKTVSHKEVENKIKKRYRNGKDSINVKSQLPRTLDGVRCIKRIVPKHL